MLKSSELLILFRENNFVKANEKKTFFSPKIFAEETSRRNHKLKLKAENDNPSTANWPQNIIFPPSIWSRLRLGSFLRRNTTTLVNTFHVTNFVGC